MPIGFSPEDTVLITLDCFGKQPPAEARPQFKCRFLTAGQTKKVEALSEAANKAASNAETDKLLNEALLAGIVGWEGLKDAAGQPVEFSAAALEEFTIRLKFQMVREYPIKLMLSDAEKKA